MDKKTIVIQIEYRRRKSFELKWMNPYKLRVLAPLGTSRKAIDQLIQDKEDWIFRSRKRIVEREQHGEKNYLNVDAIQFLGKTIPFRFEKAAHPFQLLMGAESFVLAGEGTAEEARAVIEATYRVRAKYIFQERVAHFSQRLGVRVNQIRVKAQKTRWGSCSSKGNLNFNWHAIIASEEVVDYLVVHELCHLVHMNHSKEFWELVESFCPDYKEYRKWLKNHDTQVLP